MHDTIVTYQVYHTRSETLINYLFELYKYTNTEVSRSRC